MYTTQNANNTTPTQKLLLPTKLCSQRKFLIACSAHRSKLNNCVILLAPDSGVI